LRREQAFDTVAGMGWGNPPITWKEIERTLSDRPRPKASSPEHPGDGGDSPAWSRKRAAYEPPPPHQQPRRATASTVPYAELHCHSNFSFLDGASHAEELVEEAVRLGLDALALTDHNGFYGVVRFAEAARAHGLPTVFGAELTLGLTGKHLPRAPRPPCRSRSHRSPARWRWSARPSRSAPSPRA
jgi:error-prone DNA polymerase